jgi:arsenate reductase
MPDTPQTVMFACVHNAGRSQMAAAFFNALADPHKARAVSAGTQPGERVHDVVIDAMREVDVDLRAALPSLLTPEVAKDVTWLITMGCGDACPVVPGVRRRDWPLEDPKGQSLERVREIRDDIRQRVEAFLVDHDFM